RFVQVMGAAVMAIPAGALGNAFSEVVEKTVQEEEPEGPENDEEAQRSNGKPKMGASLIRCLDGEREVHSRQITEDFAVDMADVWFGLSAFLVAASSLHFILGTLKHLPSRLDELTLLLFILDAIATLVFSVEYGIRIWKARQAGFRSSLHYIFSSFGLVDGLPGRPVRRDGVGVSAVAPV
ncbi:unnamed protein product, partial [Effrenium voratum]